MVWKNVYQPKCKEMNRILTAHYFCNRTLFRFGVEPSAMCDLCNVEETADHIFECRKHESSRSFINELIRARSTEDSITYYSLDKMQIITTFLDKIQINF